MRQAGKTDCRQERPSGFLYQCLWHLPCSRLEQDKQWSIKHFFNYKSSILEVTIIMHITVAHFIFV